MQRTLVALGTTLVLSACGGGGSDGNGDDGPGSGLTAPATCWEVPPRHVNSQESPFRQTLKALGGSGPVSFAVDGESLPPDASITVDNTTGKVDFVPPARPGRYRLNYEVSDAEGRRDNGELVLWVQPRIMPLGDSITDGKYDERDPDGGNPSERAGYRLGLWNALTDAGYPVDFVGTFEAGPNDGAFDRDHQGDPGRTARYLSGQIYDWLVTLENASSGGFIAHGGPDIVLLHAGTNDLNNEPGTPFATRDWLREMITRIDDWSAAQGRPVTIFLAQIIGRAEKDNSNHELLDEDVRALNELIPDLASEFSGTVRVVDQYSALTDSEGVPDVDLYSDRVHPNQAGYDRMAERWFEALSGSDLLGQCRQ